MNTPFQTDPQQPKDRALLDEAQRLLVKKIIQQSSDDTEMSDSRMRIYTTAIANFQKIALSRDRLVAYERRTDAHYHIAQGRNDNQLEIARIRAEAASARRRPDHPQVDEDDPLAPFGRKKDGTPYTEAEFDQSLNEAIRGIWGLKPVNPKSYMPWEMKRAPDGRLVAPDDPSVASDPSAEPPIRARSAGDGADNPERPVSKPSPDLTDQAAGASPGRPRADDDTRARSPSRDPFVIRNSSFEITTGSSSSRRETAPARYPSEDG